MRKRYFYKVTAVALLLSFSVFREATAQGINKTDSLPQNSLWKRHFEQRIYWASYKSYFADNIGIAQCGYDGIFKLWQLTPDFNLVDVGLGADALLGFDERIDSTRSRPKYARIVPGIEVNWSIRIYLIPIRRIRARIYAEGIGMSFVCYAKEYPDKGTKINIGSHLGLGMDYKINSVLRGFTSLRIFHTSNGMEYPKNPALNAIGIVTGIQFR